MAEKSASEIGKSAVKIWMIFIAFVFLFVGFAIGSRFPAGKLKEPEADKIYKLKIIAAPKSNRSGGNYELEKYFKGAEKLMRETGLADKMVALDNGVFRFVIFRD